MTSGFSMPCTSSHLASSVLGYTTTIIQPEEREDGDFYIRAAKTKQEEVEKAKTKMFWIIAHVNLPSILGLCPFSLDIYREVQLKWC